MSDTRYAIIENMVMLVSRMLLAGLFVHEGIFLAMNFPGASAAMAKLGVPPFVLALTCALQLIAGTAIVIGWQLRPAAIALGLFCVATALLFHTNFDVRNELLNFEKDLAIAGGMFVLALRGAGAWSVAGLWQRTHRV